MHGRWIIVCVSLDSSIDIQASKRGSALISRMQQANLLRDSSWTRALQSRPGAGEEQASADESPYLEFRTGILIWTSADFNDETAPICAIFVLEIYFATTT